MATIWKENEVDERGLEKQRVARVSYLRILISVRGVWASSQVQVQVLRITILSSVRQPTRVKS
jgi:hypothetical protein